MCPTQFDRTHDSVYWMLSAPDPKHIVKERKVEELSIPMLKALKKTAMNAAREKVITPKEANKKILEINTAINLLIVSGQNGGAKQSPKKIKREKWHEEKRRHVQEVERQKEKQEITNEKVSND